MSESMSPREKYYSDIVIAEMGRGSFRDMCLLGGLKSSNGVFEPFYSAEELAISRKYKEFGFLFSRELCELWINTQKHPRIRNRVLNEVELELEKMIEDDKKGCSLNKYNKFLVDWFYGDIYPIEFRDYLYNRIMGKDA